MTGRPGRRDLLAAVATGASAALAGCSALSGLLPGGGSDGADGPKSSAGTWATRRADSRRTNACAPDDPVLSGPFDPVGDERVATYRAGATPAVADGMAYVPASSGLVTAVDPRTGWRHWRGGLGSLLPATPAVTGERVVAVGSDGTFAVDRKTGELDWQADDGDPGEVAPLVAGGRLLVADGNEVVALDPASGSEAWRAGPESGHRVVRAAASGTLCAGLAADGSVFAVDPRTGEHRWSRPDVDALWTPVLVGPERVAAVEAPALVVLAGDGTTVTRVDLPATGFGPPTVLDSLLVVPTLDGVAAVDPADWSVRWTHDARLVIPPVGVGDAVVVVADEGRRLTVLSTDGGVRRRVSVPAVGAVAAGERLYLTGKRSNVVRANDA